MCMCMYVYVCVYMYVGMYVCVRVSVCMCMSVDVYVYVVSVYLGLGVEVGPCLHERSCGLGAPVTCGKYEGGVPVLHDPSAHGREGRKQHAGRIRARERCGGWRYGTFVEKEGLCGWMFACA